jgi:hypothetical protein
MKVEAKDINLNKLYDWAIERCQLSQWDNPQKRKRFIRMCQLWLASTSGTRTGTTVQVGVWHGHSAFMLQELFRVVYPNTLEKACWEIITIDGFTGLEPTKEDGPIPQKVREHFAIPDHDHLPALDLCLQINERVPQAFKSLPTVVRYEFIAIDVDLYRPTIDSLEYFWPLMLSGGIIYVDDYGYDDYPGCRKAVDEFCAKVGIVGNFEPDSGIWWVKKHG